MFPRSSVPRPKIWLAVLLVAFLMFWTLSSIQQVAAQSSTTTTLSEWTLPDGFSGPWGVGNDQFGNLWFSENHTTARIASLNPATNTLKEWDIPSGSGADPRYVFVQPTGSSVRVYFTEYANDRVGYFDNSTQTFYEWSLTNCRCGPIGIYVDVNGDMWFTESLRNPMVIARLSPFTNAYTEFKLPTPSPGCNTGSNQAPCLWGIWVQHSGTNTFVYFTEPQFNMIGRLEASSQKLDLWSVLLTGGPGTYEPLGLTLDSSGNVIYTSVSAQANRVSILRPNQTTVADYPIPTAAATPYSVVWDSSRNLAWFTEYSSGRIANLSPTGSAFNTLTTVSECSIPGGTVPSGSPSPCQNGASVNCGVSSGTCPTIGSSVNTRSPRITTVTPQPTILGPLGFGQFTEYQLTTITSGPTSLSLDNAGNIWFAESASTGNRIGRMTIVTPFSFGISSSPNTLTVSEGQLANYTVSVTPTAGTSTSVALTMTSSVPTGATFTFNPASGTPPFTSSLTIGTSSVTPVGTYPLTISGTGGGVTQTSTITLIVSSIPPPTSFDFSLNVTSSSSATITGGDTATFALEAATVSGTAQSVQMFASGQPAGVTASLNPSTGLPPYSSTLTLASSVDTSPGTYTVTITGTGGGRTHATSVSLTINAPPRDFSVSVSPDTLSAVQASSGTASVTIQSTGVFSDPVNLATSNLPAGMSTSFSPNPITPTAGGTAQSTASFSVSRSVAPGTYSVTITGTSGSLTHQATLSIRVSGCLIATATYGSELSPEVQFLQGFRDNQILQTFAGSSFMVAFNAWYYSFSPSVANYITIHETVRTGMKYVLYPLIDVLRQSSAVYSSLAFEPELAALVAGIVAGALIGVTYLALPLAGVLLVARRRVRATTRMSIAKRLAQLFVALILGFAAAEFLAFGPLMMLVSAGIILSVLALGALLPALVIVKYAARER